MDYENVPCPPGLSLPWSCFLLLYIVFMRSSSSICISFICASLYSSLFLSTASTSFSCSPLFFSSSSLSFPSPSSSSSLSQYSFISSCSSLPHPPVLQLSTTLQGRQQRRDVNRNYLALWRAEVVSSPPGINSWLCRGGEYGKEINRRGYCPHLVVVVCLLERVPCCVCVCTCV